MGFRMIDWQDLNLTDAGLLRRMYGLSLEDSGSTLSVEELNLRENRLSSLKASLLQFPVEKLTTLSLGRNCLSQLDAALFQLTALQNLDLSHNELQMVPPAISKLTVLKVLDLTSNHLSTLPPAITRLENLWNLSLEGNNLYSLPEGFANMRQLYTLNLIGNPNLPPSLAICDRKQYGQSSWLPHHLDTWGRCRRCKQACLVWMLIARQIPELNRDVRRYIAVLVYESRYDAIWDISSRCQPRPENVSLSNGTLVGVNPLFDLDLKNYQFT